MHPVVFLLLLPAAEPGVHHGELVVPGPLVLLAGHLGLLPARTATDNQVNNSTMIVQSVKNSRSFREFNKHIFLQIGLILCMYFYYNYLLKFIIQLIISIITVHVGGAKSFDRGSHQRLPNHFIPHTGQLYCQVYIYLL